MDTKTNKDLDKFLIYYCSVIVVFLFLVLGLNAWIYFQQGDKIENQQLVIEDRNKERAMLKDDYHQLAMDYALLNQQLEHQQAELTSLKEELKKSESEVKKLEKQVDVKRKEEVKVSKATAPVGKEVKVKATAYTAYCDGCSGITRTGLDLRSNPQSKVIAVDPTVIPLGSKVYVEGYGYATASDTGGAIKGKRIDVFKPNLVAAKNYGVKQVKVTVLPK